MNRIQFGGDEVVKAKGGAGSATLSMAYAGAEFASKILRAFKGEEGIVAPSYVSLEADPVGAAALIKELGTEIAYFSSNVELGVSFPVVLSFSYADFIPSRSLKGSSRLTLLERSPQPKKPSSRQLFLNSRRTLQLWVNLCKIMSFD